MSGFATARQKMVDGQVRPSDVTDIRIIDAMLAVPREAFVPENKQALAYLDLDLDVSEGGAAKRFLIKPVVLAKMLQAADIKETDRVLVVGCATGYAAAVIAQFAPQVTATESDSALAAKAQASLASNGCGNVTVRPAAPADGDAAKRALRCHRAERRNRDRAGAALRAIAQWRPIGGRFCDVTAGAGHHRDRFAWRFRSPDAVRCRCPGAARHGTCSGLRFLAFRPFHAQYSPSGAG